MKTQVHCIEICRGGNAKNSGFFRFRADGKKRGKQGAFSLVELLIVILIVAVIAAIAIPGIGDTNAAAHLTKNKRNAQNIATMFAAGQAAGVDFYADGNLGQTIQNVVDGGTVSKGSFAGEFFGVPGMRTAEATAATAYLELNQGMLVYNSND